MRRDFVLATIAVTLFGSAQASYLESESGKYISPCNYWSYDSGSMGYVCRFYDRLEVATGEDMRAMEFDLEDLESQLKSLEARVKALESNPN